MFTFLSKNNNKFGLLVIIDYLVAGFIILALIFFSWLFLFIYRHIYTTLVQEIAVINLKSQLVITKVQRARFDDLIKKIETKKTPAVIINFKGLRNPFKTE